MVAAVHPGQRAGADHDSCVTKVRNLLRNAHMFRRSALLLSSVFVLRSLHAAGAPEVRNEVIVSVKEQRLMLLQNGAQVATYPVSTSKFGVGDSSGRMTTPLGAMAVAQKIGDHAPTGAVFHNRRFTGEIIRPNAPGAIRSLLASSGCAVSRLRTSRAFSRCIYIHGTPEEKTIGRPASYGCIRMKSKDVTALYTQLPIGAVVQVVPDKLPRVPKARTVYQIQAPDAPLEEGRPAPFAKSQGGGAQGCNSTRVRVSCGDLTRLRSSASLHAQISSLQFYHGQYQIRLQTRPPDGSAFSPQSQRAHASAQNAQECRGRGTEGCRPASVP